jgi:hypothetical protein
LVDNIFSLHVQLNKDIRESLAAEVAEKYDDVIALRRVIKDLEDNCHEAEMKVRFKDDVIKRLRRDREASGCKVIKLSCSGRTHHLGWSFHYKGSCHYLTN